MDTSETNLSISPKLSFFSNESKLFSKQNRKSSDRDSPNLTSMITKLIESNLKKEEIKSQPQSTDLISKFLETLRPSLELISDDEKKFKKVKAKITHVLLEATADECD